MQNYINKFENKKYRKRSYRNIVFKISICYNCRRQNVRYVQDDTQPPQSCSSGGVLFHLEGGLDLGLLSVIYLHQAICKYSRQLHLPEQRYKMSDVNPWCPPFPTCLGGWYFKNYIINYVFFLWGIIAFDKLFYKEISG